MPIIFPTDTVYGVGASLANEADIKKLYQIKNRPPSQPTALLVAELKDLNDLITKKIIIEIGPLIDCFWPGALTIITTARPDSLYIDNLSLINRQGQVSIRMPDHKIAQQVIKEAGAPLVTSSANFRGQKPPTCFEELDPSFARQADVIYEGPTGQKEPSTVLDLTNQKAVIVRQGPITKKQLAKFVSF